MLVTATFKASGQLRLTDQFPIETDGLKFSFVIVDDMLKEIVCEFKETDPTAFPRMSRDKAIPSIEIPDSRKLTLAKEKLLVFQGAASLFSNVEFDFLSPKLDWKPEPGDDDPDVLAISINRSDQKPIILTFDIFAKSLLESGPLSNQAIPLNFLRRGKNELHKEQYIFAFMNFFLMLERLFGKGKFKKNDLVESFESSATLTKTINKMRSEFLTNHLNQNDTFYLWMKNNTAVQGIIRKLIDRRGNLFHNSLRGPTDWHPEEQLNFRAEAIFMEYLCVDVGFELIEPIFRTDATEHYISQAQLAGAIMTIKATFLFLDDDDVAREASVNIEGPGTKATNFAMQSSVKTALNYFDAHMNGMRLKALKIEDVNGLLLAKLDISV